MKITYKQIMSFERYYDPKEIGMSEDYEAELKDFIVEYKSKVKSLAHIIWTCCRQEFFNDRDLRLFGVWSASQVKFLMTDERDLKVLEVSEKFAFEEVTLDELKTPKDASCAAAFIGARATAAADFAADLAADWAADWAVACSAAPRAARAARAAARAAQIETLIKMIEKPNGEWFLEWKGKK